MKKIIAVLLVFSFISSVAMAIYRIAPVRAGVPIVIDGIETPGEWDAYYLGTSITAWQGGMQVKVYGFADSSFLYAAYEVDIPNSPGWATAKALSLGPNLYFETPTTASWPEKGFTVFEMLGNAFSEPHVLQTDGTDWVETVPDLWTMTHVTGIQIDASPPPLATGLGPGVPGEMSAPFWSADNGFVETKIPLSFIEYAGCNGAIRLEGQYWQYDWATPFYLYYLTVKTDPTGVATIAGEGWYGGGTKVTLTAPAVVGKYRLITLPFSWDVDGASQGVANPITVTMNGPHTATAHYVDTSVGGEWAPINTVQLMAPWIALGLIAIAGAAAASYRLYKKRW
jgi:hypothetical protein